MRFTASTAAFLALASRALAQTDGFDAITKPTKGEVINAGSTYQITWDYNAQYDGTISITLLEGDTPTTLELGDTFASGIDNSVGSYSWAVDSSLGDDATYGLKISLDSNSTIFQYSFPFSIAASSEGSSSSSSSILVGTTSASSTSIASSTSVSSTSSMASPSTTSTYSSVSSSASSTEPTSSEASPSETSSAKTDSSETSSPTTSASGSTSAASTGVSKTTLTSVVSSSTGTSSSTGSAATSSSSPIVTAGAGKVVAGSFAAMGGLAAALLAL